jgi:hypothetical protein
MLLNVYMFPIHDEGSAINTNVICMVRRAMNLADKNNPVMFFWAQENLQEKASNKLIIGRHTFQT